MNPHLGLFLGAFIISFSPILVKLIHLGPTWIAFSRAFVAVIGLYFFKPQLPKSDRSKFLVTCFIAGFFIGIDLFVWHRSILKIGAGFATVLGNTQVFYLLIAGVLFFNEKLSFKKIFSVIFGFFGILLMVKFNVSIEDVSVFKSGVIFGLLTGLAYAIYLLNQRKVEIDFPEIKTTSKLFFIYFFASLTLFPLSWLSGEISLPESGDIIYILLLGIGINIFGWKLLSSNMSKVSPSIGGLFLLFQPVGASIWGAIIFKEHFSPFQVLGMGMTVLAIYLASVKKKEKTKSAH